MHDYLKPDTDFEYQRHYDQGMQPTAESVADNILAGSFAAIHTTTMTLTNVLYDLAAHPEYAEVLREEIQCISAEEPSGILRKKTMPKLRKLDSFIKESQRRCTAAAITFHRKTLKAIILSEGTYLPANDYYLFSPSAAISGDPSTYEIPEEFDGLCLDKLQQRTSEDDMRYQLTSSSTQMHFGLGRHVCPGRWLASYEIKLTVITLLS